MPSDSDYDPRVHLGLGDIAFDHPTTPSLMAVTLKQSKTDPQVSYSGSLLYAP